MTDEDLAALAAWLRQTQGVKLDTEQLHDPAAAAAKYGAQARRAARGLPFGTEPSGFALATAALKAPGGGDGG